MRPQGPKFGYKEVRIIPFVAVEWSGTDGREIHKLNTIFLGPRLFTCLVSLKSKAARQKLKDKRDMLT